MSVFKDFKLDIVVNAVRRRKVDSLTPLLLTFANLLTNIYYTIWYVAGSRGLIGSVKAVSGSMVVRRRVGGLRNGP